VSVYVGRHSFTGPFRSPERIVDKAGVYALLIGQTRGFRVLEVDQSANLRTTLTRCLLGRDDEEIQVAVLYTPGVQRSGRLRLVEQIRKACE
jgi:hypothetical protein